MRIKNLKNLCYLWEIKNLSYLCNLCAKDSCSHAFMSKKFLIPHSSLKNIAPRGANTSISTILPRSIL